MRLRTQRRVAHGVIALLCVGVFIQLWLLLVKPTFKTRRPKLLPPFWTKQKSPLPTAILPKCSEQALVQGSLESLLAQMEGNNSEIWSWIQQRIERLWPLWLWMAEQMASNQKLEQRRKRRVTVTPGVLRATEFAQNKSISEGGPLGDLVQWADLIAGLHVLGHNVSLVLSPYDIARGLRYGYMQWAPTSKCRVTDPDLSFVDIISMKTMPSDVITSHGCIFRVVDAYGTEAMYNDLEYALRHDYLSVYGQLGLNLKQFYTFYPHTPDNSFLGFVVPEPGSKASPAKKLLGLLYGKDPSYFRGHSAYIQLLLTKMEVHSTLKNSSVLPPGVINHGVLSSEEYQRLLNGAKYLIGVGQPMESTGVMEALAKGCIFLNPKYTPAQQNILQKNGKPTSRKMSSQVPYLEEAVGPPYVYTVNTANTSQVLDVLAKTSQLETKPFVPYEFSLEGFLQRLSAFLEYQDFCDAEALWPPKNSLVTIVAPASRSCTNACKLHGLICEPVYFHLLNNMQVFESLNYSCQSEIIREDSIYAPAYNTLRRQCVLQSRNILFSCAGSMPNLQRICPCRDYIQYQSALCKNCL